MIQKNEPLSSKDFSKGLVTRSDIINNDPNKSPNCMDIKWYFDGAIGKRLGASTTNSVIIGSTAAAGWTINSTGTLSTSLGSYWKLEEAAGSRADQIGSNPLFDANTTGSIVGIRGQAALLVAANSNYLDLQNVSALTTGNVNFSISSWVYLNSTSTTIERTIVSKKDPEIDASTVLLLHFDGANSSNTFTDSSPSAHAMVASGGAVLATGIKQLGTSSLFLVSASNQFVSSNNTSDFDLGAAGGADYTIDFWLYLNTNPAGGTGLVCASVNGASGWQFLIRQGNQLAISYQGGVGQGPSWNPSLNTWYHIALVRMNGTVTFYVDGTSIGTTSDGSMQSGGNNLGIGSQSSATALTPLDGYIDELRITKGIARFKSNFTRPVKAYGVQEFEYWLYVNTNNNATFRVSSSGTNQTATVQASSFGALNTSTWYNVVAWHSNNAHIGISVNLSANTSLYTTGIRVGSAPFVLGAKSDSQTASANTYMDARIDETGIWNKVLTSGERTDLYGGGTGNTYSAGASGFGWAIFDFGASAIRWLTVSAGTGISASSNLGTTFVTIATSQTQTYQYLDRSKNVLIATSDAYDPPLYWAGSAGTFAIALGPTSAPLAKYSINYNGFLILFNTQARKRGFFYNDENTQLNDSWPNSFDFPSSADDEITAAFILYKFLYVSTRYRIFRTAFVGGNPDWSFLKIKDWGFVPRTAKLCTIKGSQVIIGMDWQRRLRVFDGFEDFFISDNIENDNKYCDFALQKVSYAGSGLTICHAEVDQIEQEYRLNVAIGANSSQTTHAIVLNLRTLALFPYQNQLYQAMCIAESNNQQHMMAVDRSGFVHILNSGNLDVSQAVSDVFDSPIIYKDSPTQVSKSQQLNVYFSLGSYGTIYQQERMDFSSVFSSQRPLSDKDGNTQILGSEPFLQVLRTVDVPATYNTYQFRLTSSSGTANPWKLTRFEFLQNPKGLGMGG